MDSCVVHLRVPRNAEAAARQHDQNRALLRWSMRHLAGNPKANIVIMGDFNEGGRPGSPDQSLAVLFQARPPMVDSFDRLTGRATRRITVEAAGCDTRMLARLLQGLKRPYQYHPGSLSLDWSSARWRLIPGGPQSSAVVFEWLDALEEAGDRDQLESIASRVSSALEAMEDEPADCQ